MKKEDYCDTLRLDISIGLWFFTNVSCVSLQAHLMGCYGDNYGKLRHISSMSLIGNGVLRLFNNYLKINYVPNPKLIKRHHKERIKKSMGLWGNDKEVLRTMC